MNEKATIKFPYQTPLALQITAEPELGQTELAFMSLVNAYTGSEKKQISH